MIHAIITDLAPRVMPPWIEKAGGLTQMAEREGAGDGKIQRFPISNQLSEAGDVCAPEGVIVDFIPDSKYKGMSYWEDLGTTPGKITGSRIQMSSLMRLVAWINPEKFTTAPHDQVLGSRCLAELLHLLKESWQKDISPYVAGARYTVRKIHQQDRSIFSKYSYDAARQQYLLLPYLYFAIDIQVEYFAILGDGTACTTVTVEDPCP